jgi:hypothetical protein
VSQNKHLWKLREKVFKGDRTEEEAIRSSGFLERSSSGFLSGRNPEHDRSPQSVVMELVGLFKMNS